MFASILTGLGDPSENQGLFSSLTSMDFSSGALGKLNDIYGSFTGTSASVFLEAGGKSVQMAQGNLQSNLSSNPSAALTEYSRFLNDEHSKFKNALSNSSQTKTREGNQKSMDDVKIAINAIPQLETKLKEVYNISKTLQNASRTDFGKYTTSYSYNKYTLTEKQTEKKLEIEDITNFVSDKTKTLTSEKSTNSIAALAIGVLGFLFITKKIKL
jgi:hypothetical protein